MARKIYRDILRHVEEVLGNKETYEDELRTIAKRVFGKRFAGVYAADDIDFKDIFKQGKKYAIMNASRRITGGSHWYAVYKLSDDYLLVSDSFGRPIEQYCEDIANITQHGRVKIINTDRRPEQKITEDNCGARSIAWCILCDVFGSDVAVLI